MQDFSTSDRSSVVSSIFVVVAHNMRERERERERESVDCFAYCIMVCMCVHWFYVPVPFLLVP